MDTEKKVSLSVPLAIVIAGVLIAGAVYFSNRDGTGAAAVTNSGKQNTTVKTADISINPVSAKDYIRGNPNAKVVLVEYSDLECPFCKVFQGTMKNLVDKLGKDGTLAWVYRNFPLKELHPKAPKEAEAILCAGKLGGTTGFWNLADRIYAVTPSNNGLDPAQLPVLAKEVGLDDKAFSTCLSSGEMTSLVKIDYDDGVKGGGTGTPFSVLVASKAFDHKKVQDFLVASMIKYGFPADLVVISPDNKKVSVSGAMPADFMESLVTLIAK